jgi:hypothetical protein
VADKVEIELVFTPDGQVRLETRGLKGKTCMASRTRTSEFYQQPAATKGMTRQG